MFRKINTSPNLLRWLCALILGAAVYILWFRLYGQNYLPWIAAFSMTLNEGIRLYAGDAFIGSDSGERYRMLSVLVGGYVIIPTIFFYSWRRIFREQMAASAGNSLLFIITGAMTIVLFVPSFWEAIELHNSAKKAETMQSVQTEKDELMQDVGRLAYDAYLYRILPSSSGGGGNSFIGYTPPAGAMSSAGSRPEVIHVDNGVIRFRATSSQYQGSAVSAEIDSTGKIQKFVYEGIFTM